MRLNYVNIACGDSYVEDWLNFDYVPHSPSVFKANLLGRLPLSDCTADILYSSHFFEHIPRMLVPAFLAECFRVIKPAGRVRFVLPDLEELCRSYLAEREQGAHHKADFIVLEMLDQCVRLSPRGELGSYYAQVQSAPFQNKEMVDFIKQRTGTVIVSDIKPPGSKLREAIANPAKVFYKLEQIYIRALVAMLPSAFRSQNVSMVPVGERHSWIYDFYTMKLLLEQTGFVNVKRTSATTSDIADFPFYPLDLAEDGRPRRGVESMYVEALRP